MICEAKSVEQIVEPAIADWQHECSAAPTPVRAWLCYGRGAVAVVMVVVLSSTGIAPLREAERTMVRRTLMAAACFAAGVMALLLWIPLQSHEMRWSWRATLP